MVLDSLVKYLAVGRLYRDSDGNFKEEKHVIIANQLADSNDPNAKAYKNHVKAIMSKGAAKLQPNKRIRLTSDNNDYDLHVVAELYDGDDEDKQIVFFAVTEPDFAKNFSVAQLLRDFKDGFLHAVKGPDIEEAGGGGAVQRQAQPVLDRILKHYGSSKLANVQNKVDEVKDIMKTNVQRALDNVEKLEEIEDKAEKFENQAKMFKRDATTLKRQQRCKYYKITALILLVVGVLLTIIIVPLVMKNKN